MDYDTILFIGLVTNGGQYNTRTPELNVVTGRLPFRSCKFLRCSCVPAMLDSGERGDSCSAGHSQRERQELLWRDYFLDPTLWWDNRQHKKSFRSPDFRHKVSKETLWLNNFFKPAWVDEQLSMLDTRIIVPAPLSSVSTLQIGRSNLTVPESEGDEMAQTVSKLCEIGQLSEAVDVLGVLVQAEYRVSTSVMYTVLKKCVTEKNLVLGRRVHDLVVKIGYGSNAFLGNHILRMYASLGRLQAAMDVFTSVSKPDAFMWFSIISACAKAAKPKQAIQLYHRMRTSGMKPDGHVFVAVLQACARAVDPESGRQVHDDVLETGVSPDMFVCNCLVDMYAKCGKLEDARKVFDSLTKRDVVTWNSMIAGYAQHGHSQKALALYARMELETLIPVNGVTFACLVKACANAGALEQGKRLHAQILERGLLEGDRVVGSCLVDMYAKCGKLEDARRLFDSLTRKDVVTWTAMITGYAEHGLVQEALALYARMRHDGLILADSVTFACLLHACANVAGLPFGKQLHKHIEEQGLQADVVVGTSLVNMYAKCGSLEDAQQVFDSLPERDSVAWNALIAGYARQGDSIVVFDSFERMRLEGMQPNDITFLSVLTVCSHVGLVEKGQKYFESMSTDYGITPAIEHHTCMIDLLGRAGHLSEALQMVKSLPFQPNGTVWLTLLGSCQKWSNVEVGRQAFEFAVRLDEKDAAAYVLMSNIYAASQMWEEAKEMQARRKKSGAWKQPGQSWWADMGGMVHNFGVVDMEHDETQGTSIKAEKY